MKSASLSSLALLSTVATSSPGFAPPYHKTTANNRIRRKLVARTILSHNNDLHSEFARYTASSSATTDKQKQQQLNDKRNDSSIPTPTSATALVGEMVESQREFEINLGRAVDTLKRDYPKLLTRDPDWKIYHDDLEVIDPTGVSLHGLSNYKRAFSFIHAVVYMFYCEEKSGLTFRTVYDWARKSIRYVVRNCSACVHALLVYCLSDPPFIFS
jgi:Uncharacterized conserved protein (DUF2358)